MQDQEERELRQWFENALSRLDDKSAHFDVGRWRGIGSRRTPRRKTPWTLAAVTLFGGLILAGVIMQIQRSPAEVQKPNSSVHPNKPHLTLAVLQAGAGGNWDPLWIGWKQDRSALARIQAAIISAKRIRSFAGTPWSSYRGSVGLWFSDGSAEVVQPYDSPNQTSGDELLVTTGSQRTELIRSATLVSIVKSHADFSKPTPLTVRASASGDLTVQGGGAVGSSVTVYVAPSFGYDLGLRPPPSAFRVGGAKVVGGEYSWQGKVTIPSDFAVYHPMTGWGVAVQVQPFKPLAQELPTSIFTVPLPTDVLPVVSPSAVASSSAALAAVRSAPVHAGSGFPVWLAQPGKRSISWLNVSGRKESGTETASVTQQGSAYHVVVRLTYGQGDSQSYREEWLVGVHGQVTFLKASGSKPGIEMVLPTSG